MISWPELSRDVPFTRKFVEETLLPNYDRTAVTEHILGIRPHVTLPKYPIPWRKRRVTSHTISGGVNMDGMQCLFTETVEGHEQQAQRRSVLVFRENEGMLMCVEYKGRFMVVLLNRYLYIYMNGHFLFMDYDLAPRRLPWSLLAKGNGNAKYIQLECEHYISLFTIFHMPHPASSSSLF